MPRAATLVAALVLAAGLQVRTGARWIWSGAAETAYFRQVFDLSVAPAAARLEVEGRGSFVVHVNGVRRIAAGPPRLSETAWITRSLHAGRNVLAIESSAPSGARGIRFTLDIRFPDGRTARIHSDEGVLATVRVRPGWQEPRYDDSRWRPADVLPDPRPAAPLPGAERPATQVQEPPRPAVPTSPAVDLLGQRDASRLVRVWDLGGRPGEDPYTRPRAPGERMPLAANVPAAAQLPALVSAGFTLYQTDSDHLSTDEAAPGVWDFRQAESDLRWMREHGLDWSYFPHFAFPPKWYRDSIPFTRIRCLEHDQTAEAFSPWEPRFGPFAARGYSALADRFRPPRAPAGRRAPAGLSAVCLGVHGDYGEVGFLTGARLGVPAQRDEWLRLFGNLHNHQGWWCGDPLARTAFRADMLRKYGSLEVLNAAWRTSWRSEEEIAYPPRPGGGSRRHWLDWVNWYLNAGASVADTVCRVARRTFPETLLMLPAGLGDENPRGGADNSLIAKIAARHGVDVRSTHGGFRPFAENQATMLGRLASAARFYGAPLWTEPPGRLTPEQVVERIFSAASLGSRGLFDWADNIAESREAYYRYGRHLRAGVPVVDVAMLYPTTAHLLRPDEAFPPVFAQGCAQIRDVLNYDIVDERMIRDGALDRFRVLVMWEGTVAEADTLARIRDWVQGGGVLAAYDFGKIETVEGDRAWFTELFGYAGRLRPAVVGTRAAEAGRRPEAAIDLARLRSEWARPFGRGWTVFFPATRRNLAGYLEVVRYLAYHLSDLEPGRHDAIAVDNAWDGAYATLLTDRILYYNPGPGTLRRTIVLSPEQFRGRDGLGAPESFTHQLELEPHAISSIPLGPAQEELLLQCEKFTGLGALRPLTGPLFSPESGPTHVLIPVGGQITTRFQCDVAGRYRVHYRAWRRGRIAPAEILLDGVRPEPARAASPRLPMETLVAGEVTLSRGIHTLAFAPRRGEDVRADFVVLSSDPAIAGYRFAVRAPGGPSAR